MIFTIHKYKHIYELSQKNQESTTCAICRFFYLSFYNNMAGCVIIILDNLNLINTSRTARIVVLTDYYVGVEIVKTF